MSTELQVANMAYSEIGEFQLTAMSDGSSFGLQQLFDQTRDELLAEARWRFSLKRTRLTAKGLLDASGTVITITGNTAPTADTIVRDIGSWLIDGFLDGDRAQIKGSDNNNSAFEIESAVALTLTSETSESLTTETLTNDTDLKIYASPAYNWTYKYAKPSDFITIWEMNEFVLEGQANPKWDEEGDYLVTDEIDSNDQINILYALQQTDVTKWPPLFVKAHYKRLASKLAIPVAHDKDLKKELKEASDDAVKLAKKKNAVKGRTNLQRKDTGWQRAISS